MEVFNLQLAIWRFLIKKVENNRKSLYNIKCNAKLYENLLELGNKYKDYNDG